MTKLINLDELAGVDRTVTFKGEKHEVENLGVLDFVKAQTQVDAMQTAFTEKNYTNVVECAVNVCALAIPSLKSEDVRKMRMKQITALVAIVMDVYPDAQKEVSAAEAAKADPSKVGGSETPSASAGNA